MRNASGHDCVVAGEIFGLGITEPNALGKLSRAIESAVARSFAEDGSTPTNAEARRRGQICLTLVRELRGDLKWSLPRICDALPRGLRAKLDGIPWNPENERAVWTPPRDLVIPGR